MLLIHFAEGVEINSYFSCLDMIEALNGKVGEKASYLDYAISVYSEPSSTRMAGRQGNTVPNQPTGPCRPWLRSSAEN